MNAINNGIFHSAQEAIAFACNYSSQQYAMSPMAKLLQGPSRGSGRGLVGLDGAGQAGMVFAELARIDYWQLAALVTGRLPHSERCDCQRACCRGWRLNPMFEEAVNQLADHVALTLTPVPPVKEFRIAVIMKYFGEKADPLDTAKHLGIPKNAAERHITNIRRTIRELEKNGITALSARLDEIGMLVRAT
ncbi:hypothetical protein B0G62_102168 [Paraburkholderia eburnea]|uniref:Uncharacterized protein n=1 Tax=Paraburkholderia eburnea TaxID=1189126 RepID=A0A2S4MIK0_9BURK|nr:hypothetical protein [Paraburkholderia eburnea]POR54560.1 hypothetical protein B0G62_102168 [Paraburkholderia eburnea]PRZ19775.1 hypothetical protein BX588_114168 [Paraburkholderia eburnea]